MGCEIVWVSWNENGPSICLDLNSAGTVECFASDSSRFGSGG